MTKPPETQIADLQRRIQDLKADVAPEKSPSDSSPSDAEDKQGLGAAYELIMTPIVCGGIGAGVDHLFSTAPTFFIILAFLGVCAGFWRIYRVSNNIQTPLDLKRLQPEQKNARNTQLYDSDDKND